MNQGNSLPPVLQDGSDMQGSIVGHLNIIENAIARMANHSFLLKGWSITLVAALLALSARDPNPALAAVAFLPALSFWGLDAYYLRQERLFRRLFDSVRQSAATAAPSFAMSTHECANSVPTWFRTLWAPTVVGVHGPIIVTAIVVLAVLWGRFVALPCSPVD